MILTSFLFFLSLVIVIIGAKFFLTASISLAKVLRIPEMVIGATLVSLATTMPESLVSVFASATGHTTLALGNVVGSGLVNLGMIFGMVLLAGHGYKEREERGRRRSLILSLVVVGVFLWLLIFRQINFYAGLLLIGVGACFLAYTFWYSLKEAGETLGKVEAELESHPRVLGKFLLGSLLLVGGTKFLVESASSLAVTLGLSEIIIGISLVAIGTSLPELVMALTALFAGHEKLSLGNLTGATVLTFTIALGLIGIIRGVEVSTDLLFSSYPLLLVFSLVVILFAFVPKIPQKLLGFFLVLSYLVYIISPFI